MRDAAVQRIQERTAEEKEKQRVEKREREQKLIKQQMKVCIIDVLNTKVYLHVE